MATRCAGWQGEDGGGLMHQLLPVLLVNKLPAVAAVAAGATHTCSAAKCGPPYCTVLSAAHAARQPAAPAPPLLTASTPSLLPTGTPPWPSACPSSRSSTAAARACSRCGCATWQPVSARGLPLDWAATSCMQHSPGGAVCTAPELQHRLPPGMVTTVRSLLYQRPTLTHLPACPALRSPQPS